MAEPTSGLDFRLMSLALKVRDVLSPRKNVLAEVGIRPGFHVLDFGCGPGGYVTGASQLVGESGRVFALDIHPLAVRSVQGIASKRGLANVEAIRSDCATGLPDASIDVVLLYDAFHALSDPHAVLEELHRVLKAGGTLSFSDHHMKEDELISSVADSGLFRLSAKGKRTYAFVRDD